ncbi:unnamed protein product [Pleuronectes platessa]|uniref:Uncharacterized protein n=1 Tax=Pleuronectes platessa TaxID=8262 RepID=A0A9N7VFW2_PLEPL|nr:unnamed protein product [Pleuronectes platessa]
MYAPHASGLQDALIDSLRSPSDPGPDLSGSCGMRSWLAGEQMSRRRHVDPGGMNPLTLRHRAQTSQGECAAVTHPARQRTLAVRSPAPEKRADRQWMNPVAPAGESLALNGDREIDCDISANHRASLPCLMEMLLDVEEFKVKGSSTVGAVGAVGVVPDNKPPQWPSYSDAVF